MSEKRNIRLGIYYSPFPGWNAYTNYLSNLIFALKSLDPTPELFLLTKKDTEVDPAINLIDKIIIIPDEIKIPTRLPNLVKKVINKLKIYFESDMVDQICLRQNIDAIFAHSIYKPRNSHKIPVISWIPDFQHLHMPHIFSVDEINYRNWEFREISQKADCILVSSQNTLDDLLNFAPETKNKSKVASFVTQIDTEVYQKDPEATRELYKLPHRFFYLPNQFWIHKNHRIVIDALEILHNTNPEIAVVCSGALSDYRDPSHFSNILGDLSKKNIRGNFIILGMIPYSDVHQLMRQSCAILQPSLFEGWSTTVEEAKSLGKPLLLSDIAVHREQNPANSYFFNPYDANDLAIKMKELFQYLAEGPNKDNEENAQLNLPSRTQEFGISFMRAIQIARINCE